MSDDKVRASAYLVIQAQMRGGRVVGAKVKRSVQSKPAVDWDEIAVRVHIDLPANIFARITPEAVIDVPGDVVVHPVVEATVAEPEREA